MLMFLLWFGYFIYLSATYMHQRFVSQNLTSENVGGVNNNKAPRSKSLSFGIFLGNRKLRLRPITDIKP